VWHDAANAIVMVENIRDALVSADPANAALYEANATSTIARLQALDAWVRQQVATLPQERRKLVTSHDTFGYFAAAYGFEILGTALGSLSTEAGDPSARAIGQLVEEIKSAGVPAIFAENVANPDLMASIAAEAGVELAPTLYTDALGPPGSPGETYEGMMRSNVTTIVDALRG
jgi:ABC-type Zn uptake system ZnuABC Zn-binding protein ZnuA